MTTLLVNALLLALSGGTGIVLPPPGGTSAVGTRVCYLVDDARRDAPFPDGRPITLQLWYPTTAADATKLAPYLFEDGLARVLRERGYYEVEPERLEEWGKLVTNSRTDAPPAPGPHALLTFSVGLGVVRANYTTLAEEFASHGFVFALVESPLAGRMLLPDGTVIEDASDRLEHAAGHRDAVDEWTRDVSFALDRLAGEGELAPFDAAIDWTRVAALGHSSGGLVALQLAASEPRVRAAIDLDGGLVTPEGEPLARVVASGATRPALLLRSRPLYDDADFARRGLTREQWEARGAAGNAALGEFVARSASAVTLARVAGTGHFSFSDAPFAFPAAITRFGGRVIEPRRGLEVIGAAIRAFLDDTLAPAPSGAFARALGEFPELERQLPDERAR